MSKMIKSVVTGAIVAGVVTISAVSAPTASASWYSSHIRLPKNSPAASLLVCRSASGNRCLGDKVVLHRGQSTTPKTSHGLVWVGSGWAMMRDNDRASSTWIKGPTMVQAGFGPGGYDDIILKRR